MAIFEFLRLSLSVPNLGPLYGGKRIEPKETRGAFIKYIFRTRIDFFYNKTLFSFVPAQSESLRDGLLAGFIGRKVSELENSGPEQMFALQPRNTWKAAFVVVDADPDVQCVAVERRSNVGASDSVIKHLVDARINEYEGAPWHVDIEYISNKDGFYEAAKKYKGKITEISFVFHPPNGLRGFDKFKELDKIAHEETNSEQSEYSLKNKNGAIVPEGDFIASALEYAAEGAGKAQIRAGKRTVFDNRKTKRTADIPESLMPREAEELKVAGTSEMLMSNVRKSQKNAKD